MTSGKRAALVVVMVVAIAIAVVVALQSQPAGNSENAEDNPPADGSAQAVNTTKVESCDAVSSRIRSIVATIDGIETEESREAAERLVEEYCKRAHLVQEIGAMTSPAIGLVAYGCDASSGRLGDPELQQSLQDHATRYCDNAFVTIFEELEFLLVDVDAYREVLQAELEEEGGENATSTVNMEEVESKLQGIADLAAKAKSLLRSDKYYEAAKAYDAASKSSDELARSTG